MRNMSQKETNEVSKGRILDWITGESPEGVQKVEWRRIRRIKGMRDGRDDAFIGYEGVVGSISVQFGEEMGKRNQSWLTCFCLSFRSLGFVASFFLGITYL